MSNFLFACLALSKWRRLLSSYHPARLRYTSGDISAYVWRRGGADTSDLPIGGKGPFDAGEVSVRFDLPAGNPKRNADCRRTVAVSRRLLRCRRAKRQPGRDFVTVRSGRRRPARDIVADGQALRVRSQYCRLAGAARRKRPAAAVVFLRRDLQQRFPTLAAVSERWHGSPNILKSWKEIHATEIAEFAGFGPNAIDLQGTWRVKYTEGTVPAEWFQPGFDDSGWDEFDAPKIHFLTLDVISSSPPVGETGPVWLTYLPDPRQISTRSESMAVGWCITIVPLTIVMSGSISRRLSASGMRI